MSFILNWIATTNNNDHSGSDNLYQQMEMKQTVDTATLSFRDGTDQWMAKMNDSYDKTRDVTYHEDVPLGDFFRRPIKIAEYDWGTADASSFFQSFDPWSLYITNKRVSNRMSNFQNFSGTLHVKFVINGNSFMYGRIMCDYFPLKPYDIASVVTVATDNRVQASQRLHIYLDPTQSQGGEMELPFIWFRDKVNLCSGQYANLGTMYMREFQPLKHANGAVSVVNINVFAWMTDVKLSIPTVQNIAGLVAQAGTMDEYGKSPVSSMAASIASAAGKLNNVPMIGRYARATQMMVGAMGSVASIFGFSRPAVINDYTDVKAAPVSRLANYNTSDNVAKLSLDCKQELSIDPTIVGVSPGDELAISALVTKESYLTTFTWAVSTAGGTALFGTRVGPVARVDTSIPVKYYLPAHTYATMPFKYWRGSIVYRFQIVASGFHKGRMLLVWDPRAQVTAPETNVQYSKIVDLAEERDFTFEVGWGADTTYLNVPYLTSLAAYNNTGTITTVDATESFNGVLSVYVLNELSTPNSAVNNDIQINVFVSGCEDYKVSVPTDVNINQLAPITSLVPQSGTYEEVVTEQKNAPTNEAAKETFAMCQPLVSDADSVYFGETVVSLRQLMRRYSLWSSLSGVVNAARHVQTLRMPDFPAHRGYSALGAVAYVGAGGAGNYNPSFTTILQYLAPAYLGMRGGIRHKVVLGQITSTACAVATVTRDSEISNYPAIYARANIDVITSQFAFAATRINTLLSSCQAGGHLVPLFLQNALEFEIPMYTNNRFLSTRNLGVRGNYAADNFSHTLNLEVGANTVVPSYDVFLAAAEDTTFIGFQGAPVLANVFVV